jgi:phosphohistidine phosphatase
MSSKDTPEDKNVLDGSYELCIVRHGTAVARGSEGFSDDSKRPLTPDGTKRMMEIAEGLCRLRFDVEWIVSSPLLRAAETAQIIAQRAGPSVPFDFCDHLQPGGSPGSLISFLAKHADRRRVLVVGHEPDLSAMAAQLIGAGRHANLKFKKGGCCLIIFDEFPPKSPGELVWWLTPRVLRKLA